MKRPILKIVSIAALLLFSNLPQAATLNITACPGKSTTYAINQEGTLKVFLSGKTFIAKILPEKPPFQVFNPNLLYTVTPEAIAAMKSTLDLAASMMRGVIIYYDDSKVVSVDGSESGFQMWGITGPLPRASSLSCLQ